MSFAVTAGAYDRFMGRYAAPLAGVFTAYAGSRRAIDAIRERSPDIPDIPDIDVRQGVAEELPYGDGAFDAVGRARLESVAREPTGSFTVTATAWAARATV